VTVLDVYDTIAAALTTTETGLSYWHLARPNDQRRVVNLLRRWRDEASGIRRVI
jgi:hypothetical protein